MKKNFLLPFLLLLLFSCKNVVKNSAGIFKTGNLQSSFITLESGKAYRLKTARGTRIGIGSNSFKVAKGANIQLEIKEAYTPQEILLAGLSTESNGKLLKSGGMIYINARVDGKEISLNESISISVPSKTYDPQMQLFTGEVNADSTVNWVDPAPLTDTTQAAKYLLYGKGIYQGLCANCHRVLADFNGPAMAGTEKRIPNKQWLYDFIKSPAKMIGKGDPYSVALFNKWKPTVMTAFPQLQKETVDAIYAYIENERKLNPDQATYKEYVPLPDSSYSYAPSPCADDTVFIPEPDNSIVPDTSVANDLMNNSDTDTRETFPMKPADMEGFRNGFTDNNTTAGMYDFKIATLGWYNIDAEVEGYTNTKYVSLKVTVDLANNSADMSLYLFCPDRKMLSVGIKKETGEFVFDKINGKIPLFLNDRAILLAIGSNNSKMYFGTKEFNVAPDQSFNIKIAPTTEDALKDLILKNNIEGIRIDTYKKEYEIIKNPCDGSDTAKASK